MQLSLSTESPDHTAAIAVSIGRHLGPGDVVLLEGPIGAGKTHFARALIQDYMRRDGTVEDVPSPTFTLVQTYLFSAAEIWHADLYRLSDPNEIIELGLEEAFESSICLIEWPDRLASLTPDTALSISFSAPSDSARILTMSGPDRIWAKRLPQMVCNAA